MYTFLIIFGFCLTCINTIAIIVLAKYMDGFDKMLAQHRDLAFRLCKDVSRLDRTTNKINRYLTAARDFDHRDDDIFRDAVTNFKIKESPYGGFEADC